MYKEQATPDCYSACLGAFPNRIFVSNPSIGFGFLQGTQAHGPDIALLIFRGSSQQIIWLIQGSMINVTNDKTLRSMFQNKVTDLICKKIMFRLESYSTTTIT
ncbi:hypothetical protein AVEN_96223-1 [Araneus ventricosus]|uniref:Uncharacterized protein n=1 Tax=Araneus ventricosus TaxID=182803 RepID=A0A4Y2V8K7_ARAVE|nr:hypothetical protein AVEN_96223-1 [Araneus ventricosus]